MPLREYICNELDDLIVSILGVKDENNSISIVNHLVYNHDQPTFYIESFSVMESIFSILIYLFLAPRTYEEVISYYYKLSGNVNYFSTSHDWDRLLGVDYINSHWDGSLTLDHSYNVVNGLKKYFLGIDYAKI